MPALRFGQLVTTLLGVGLVAGVPGCSQSDSDTPPPVVTAPTSTAPAATTPSVVPEPGVAPAAPAERHGRLRPRRPRAPRVSRQTMRTALAEAIATRRPGRPLPAGDLERLTNQAMHIRVMRSRLTRMRPTAADTPRAQKLRARLDVMVAEFQTLSGINAAELPALLDPTLPPTK